MANYDKLKAAIEAVIYKNHRGEITGEILQHTLIAVVNSLGSGYQFAGVANPSTRPGTPDEKMFYIAGPGTYQGFGDATIGEGNIGFFTWDSGPQWNFVNIATGQARDDKLTFTAVNPGDHVLKVVKSQGAPDLNLEYSLDGKNWQVFTDSAAFTGQIHLRGVNDAWSLSTVERNRISVLDSAGDDALFNVEGNIMSLLYGRNDNNNTTIPCNYCFTALFTSSRVNDASGLILPAQILTEDCYREMFSGCYSLSAAPKLPAMVLARDCYNKMFQGCSVLQRAPELPAMTLAEFCYNGMFADCINLENAPDLPAFALAASCYREMFKNCTRLARGPVLPASALAPHCYREMFYNCSSLTSAPALPATALSEYCYHSMFRLCVALTAAPALPAMVLANYCYAYMFYNCGSLVQAPALPAMLLVDNCYYAMFRNCTALASIKCLAEDITASGCTRNWTDGVSTTGTFTKKAGVTWPSGQHGIPNGWTVIDR